MAFGLFRGLDVAKPGPVGWADRRPGAWGVMLDDLVAGMLAALGLLALGAAGVPWGR
jgi:phosphatidylglycerophosphatase A